jgi:NADPH:quinone reductase-like Zn-dependent oxidoreductase
MTMHAAVVHSFDHPPRYERCASPVPAGDEVLVEVMAVGLHPRVRTDAAGRHYTSTRTLPMIPGIDGVGRLEDGRRVYFVAPDGTHGTLAQRSIVDPRRMVPLPEDTDVATVAAGMNPAMSSWVALRLRVPLQPGQSLLVLGATGNAGAMAVQVARRLGAGRVVGAGRNPERLGALPGLGADVVVALTDDRDETTRRLAEAAAEVDVVLDYLWGDPAVMTMTALLEARADRSRALDWVQIGAIAGPTIELPSVLLRAANLRIQGTGQGSVSPRAYLAELPALVDELDAGRLEVTVHRLPLAEVEAAWSAPEVPGRRTVFVP